MHQSDIMIDSHWLTTIDKDTIELGVLKSPFLMLMSQYAYEPYATKYQVMLKATQCENISFSKISFV